MKIVLIEKDDGPILGGVEIYNRRLCTYLKSFGHQVYIFRFTKKPHSGKNIISIPYYFDTPTAPFHTPFIIVPSEKTPALIYKNLKSIKPDIVYTTLGLSPWDFFLPTICHSLKIPIAGVWHVDFNNHKSAQGLLVKSILLTYLPLCLQLDFLHVLSEKLKKFYTDKGLKTSKIGVIPNGVDSATYKPGISSFAKKHNIKQGILFLARLTAQKNPEVLIKSFLHLNPPKTTKLIIVGNGDRELNLRQKYQDNRIIFTGLIDNESQKIDIIRACQIFVLPSKFEGVSLALLEAMSCGLACIATNVGSNDTILKNIGTVLPDKKLQSNLIKALNNYLENPQLVSLHGQKAREKILKHHSLNQTFGNLLKLLEDTAKKYPKHKRLQKTFFTGNLEIKKVTKLLNKLIQNPLST